jgi:2-keto-3-deoxy-galactonokinase
VEAGVFEYYNGRKMLRASAPAIAALTEEKDAYRDALLETQEQLMDLQAELRELRAVVLARHRAADAELASLYRERAIARARAAERDPNAMLN